MSEENSKPVRQHMDLPIPSDLRSIHKRMKSGGAQMYVVGGAVRDKLLNKAPKDYDLATNVPPEKVMKILSKDPLLNIKPVGEAFGVVLVKTPEGNEYEIATFRKDIGKGRRPDSVEFTDIKSDVQRRDLTINALFYDMDSSEVVDYVGGIKDLEKGVIKAVGDPAERFDEDKLRVLRAIRFAGRMGSDLDDETKQAILDDPYLDQVSQERIRDEFLKGIESAMQVPHFLGVMDSVNMFDEVLPGLDINKDYSTTKDVPVQVALLLRDNPVDAVIRTLKEMRFTNDEQKQVSFLVALQELNEDTAPDMKKKYSSSGLSAQQVAEFSEESQSVDRTMIDAFLKFVEMPPAGNPRELMKQGLRGPDIGKAMASAESEAFLSLLGESMLRDYVSDLLIEDCGGDENVVRQFIRSVITGPRLISLSVNGSPLVAEIADSHETRSMGLMYRDELSESSGMLFVFENNQVQSFWMKNTKIPLSIAYVNELGEIVDIKDMVPHSMDSIRSTTPVVYALEMNRGWFSERGIKRGDTVLGLPTKGIK
jgi:tRNA nucleotidyltransferase/poly(A) polymerase/uncharacterized membrane protein (UPF0127 family)